jgi:2-keto-4-pentenoate hydratase/2-oxohepta-3-ene-1,7-dioic acid hydratase in catechol pathway
MVKEVPVKVVVFGPQRRTGVLHGDDVIDIELACAKVAREVHGHRLPYAFAAANAPADLEQFIQLGARAIEAAQEAIEYVEESAGDRLAPGGEQVITPSAETKLHAPLAHRGVKLCMAGANYSDHLLGIRQAEDPNITAEQVREESRQRGIGGFWKLAAFVVGPDEDVVYPAKTRYLDFEGEVAVVIGTPARDAKGSDLLDHIWGYTLVNDWSARDQRDAVIGTLTFSAMKNWDTSGSVGPFISVGEIDDPQDIPFQTLVNGALRQDGNTRDMTFTFAEYLEFMSRDLTFEAGDLIAAGTCQGTAMDSTPRVEGGGFASDALFLNPGDLVEVSSPYLGTLRNRIVAKQ